MLRLKLFAAGAVAAASDRLVIGGKNYGPMLENYGAQHRRGIASIVKISATVAKPSFTISRPTDARTIWGGRKEFGIEVFYLALFSLLTPTDMPKSVSCTGYSTIMLAPVSSVAVS